MYNSISQFEGGVKPLVVYYSLTGKTKLVAQAIAEALNATLLEIKETKPRKLGPFVYLTGGCAAFMNRGSKINPIDVDLKQYERIFIGSPMWVRDQHRLLTHLYTRQILKAGVLFHSLPWVAAMRRKL